MAGTNVSTRSPKPSPKVLALLDASASVGPAAELPLEQPTTSAKDHD